jgi:hypothetical protein
VTISSLRYAGSDRSRREMGRDVIWEDGGDMIRMSSGVALGICDLGMWWRGRWDRGVASRRWVALSFELERTKGKVN